MSRNLIGIVAGALSRDARSAMVQARQLGFGGIVFDSGDLPELSQTGKREFRHLLSSNAQQLIALSVSGKVLDEDVERVLLRADRAMENAKGLGASLVCFDVGRLPAPKRESKPKPKVTQEMAGLIIVPQPKIEVADEPPVEKHDQTGESRVDDVLREIGVRTDRYGITVALRSELSGFAALHRAIVAASCPWFGVDLDPVAVLRDEWGMDDIFSALGPLVKHVRGRDAIKGQGHRTQPTMVGKGNVQWDHLRQLLDEAGYAGAITVDPLELQDRITAARAGLDYFRGTSC